MGIDLAEQRLTDLAQRKYDRVRELPVLTSADYLGDIEPGFLLDNIHVHNYARQIERNSITYERRIRAVVPEASMTAQNLEPWLAEELGHADIEDAYFYLAGDYIDLSTLPDYSVAEDVAPRYTFMGRLGVEHPRFADLAEFGANVKGAVNEYTAQGKYKAMERKSLAAGETSMARAYRDMFRQECHHAAAYSANANRLRYRLPDRYMVLARLMLTPGFGGVGVENKHQSAGFGEVGLLIENEEGTVMEATARSVQQAFRRLVGLEGLFSRDEYKFVKKSFERSVALAEAARSSTLISLKPNTQVSNF